MEQEQQPEMASQRRLLNRILLIYNPVVVSSLPRCVCHVMFAQLKQQIWRIIIWLFCWCCENRIPPQSLGGVGHFTTAPERQTSD